MLLSLANSFQKKDRRFLLIKLDKPVKCFSRYEQWKELYRMISTTKRIYKRIRKHLQWASIQKQLLAGHIEDPPQTETKKNTLDNNLQQWTMIMNYISVKQVFNILSFTTDKFWDK